MKKIILLFFILVSIFTFEASSKDNGQRAAVVKSHAHEYEDGICTICGLMCSHSTIINDECTVCHMIINTQCRHHFSDGICMRCGYECPHDFEKCNQRCTICGYVREHNYVDGEFIYCGDKMNYETGTLNSKYKTKVADDEAGSVEKVVFQSYDYANNCAFENTFFVYLPNSYYKDTTKEYNVIYLLHGSGENAAYWLAQLSYKGGYTEATKILLDNLHKNQECEETIVVTPTFNLNKSANFHKELINNIMIECESRYRTKAGLYNKNKDEIKAEDFISSRDYRAFAGLSHGSKIAWTIMAYDLPYFAYFGMFSGGLIDLTYLHTDLTNTLEETEYDIKFAYNACATNDSLYSDHRSAYNYFMNINGKLREDNTCFVDKGSLGHTYNTWLSDLYNCMTLVFFKYN